MLYTLWIVVLWLTVLESGDGTEDGRSGGLMSLNSAARFSFLGGKITSLWSPSPSSSSCDG